MGSNLSSTSKREGQPTNDAKRDHPQLQSDERIMPAKRSDDVDSLLKNIARDISDDGAIEDLGKELNFTVAEIQNAIRTNNHGHKVTNYGTLCMLREWRDRVSPSSLRSDLRGALIRANLVRIAETHFQSGSVPTAKLLTTEQVQQCKEELKEHYRQSRRTVTLDPINFTNCADLDAIYTDLSLKDQHGEHETPITLEDLLTMVESGEISKHLLIEGEGGVGKTMLCSKIAWDWCQGRLLQDLDMVVVIPLREVKNETSIGGIIKGCLSDTNAATALEIDNYISTNLTKVLLVFDGFDGFSGNIGEANSSEVVDILALNKWKSCRVMVTTRPWRADEFEMNQDLAEAYTCISVDGFNKENVSNYIRRCFRLKNKEALAESLISFMEENDVIRSNIAPFPIYCSMLCLMWGDFTEEEKKKMTKLQTFSEIVREMILFLKGHYFSKEYKHLENKNTAVHLQKVSNAIQDIGKIALKELIKRNFSFPEKRFEKCRNALETCCKLGVLTRKVSARKHRRDSYDQAVVKSTVFFPHELFQEYVAGLYIANLHHINRRKYEQLKKYFLSEFRQFRYLLYFASAFRKELSLDIMKKCDDQDFCVDVAFECQTEEAARAVGKRWKEYSLSPYKSQHVNAGVIYMVHSGQVQSLSIDEVNYGRNGSRDLAELLCTNPVLRKITITHSQFHSDFYKIIRDQASTSQIQDLKLSFDCWNDGSQHQSSMGGDLAKCVFTLPNLLIFSLKCPYLDGNFLSTAAASASSCQIQNLELSFQSLDDCSEHRSSMWGDLTRLVFNMSTLSSFKMACPCLDGNFFSTVAASASACQISKLSIEFEELAWTAKSSSASNIVKFLCHMPNLKRTTIECRNLPADGAFFTEIASQAAIYEIQDITLNGKQLNLRPGDQFKRDKKQVKMAETSTLQAEEEEMKERQSSSNQQTEQNPEVQTELS
ncbi:uncharacterized protein [Diadema setosum]|uniref:uncharacterized protein n=1 Tax=Diadema setosum TaxID=31175 RepID=UPI003B3A4C42